MEEEILINDYITLFTNSRVKISLIQYLKKKNLSYNDAIHMIWYLGKQQKYLLSLGYGLYGLELSDIVVMDGCKFFCVNPHKIVHLDEKGHLSFLAPFSHSDFGFLAPEILVSDCVPSFASPTCFFYSLGLIVIYSMFGSKDKEELDVIYGTKLYWCILRLLYDRCLLFV